MAWGVTILFFESEHIDSVAFTFLAFTFLAFTFLAFTSSLCLCSLEDRSARAIGQLR